MEMLIMTMCYFCNKKIDGAIMIDIIDRSNPQNNIFREYVCSDCSRTVVNSLLVLKDLVPKKEV